MQPRPIKQVQSITEDEAKSLDILIAEDQTIMRNLLGSILRSLSVENFEGVSDGEQAVRIYDLRRHDIVFLDIDMPGMDGLSTLQALKNINPNAFVVMVSAHSSVENVKKALQIGARGFVVKPFTKGKIVEMLKNFITHRNACTGTDASSKAS